MAVAVQRPPTSNIHDIKLIEAWRPNGSSTVLWAQDMTGGKLLHLVQWGNRIYLPVVDGIHLGIGIYNGANNWRAYPTFIEATNLWSGSPADPNDCTSDHMWELPAMDSMVMDALVNPDAQKGRSLTIASAKGGYGIGKATFGTNEYRGQIRVYERTASRGADVGYRSFNPTRGGGISNGFPSNENTRGPLNDVFMGGGVRGASLPEIHTEHQVAIGAGAERQVSYRDTGLQYYRDSKLVVALQTESRRDLWDVLLRARRSDPQWVWQPSHANWYINWPTSGPSTAPQVPVAPEPHRPSGSNWGQGW